MNETYPQFLLFSILVGIASGATGALPITVLADMFTPERLSTALGFRALLTGSIVLVAPALIGVVIDMNNSYKYGQYVCSAGVALAALLNIIAQGGLKRRHDKMKFKVNKKQDILNRSKDDTNISGDS